MRQWSRPPGAELRTSIQSDTPSAAASPSQLPSISQPLTLLRLFITVYSAQKEKKVEFCLSLNKSY